MRPTCTHTWCALTLSQGLAMQSLHRGSSTGAYAVMPWPSGQPCHPGSCSSAGAATAKCHGLVLPDRSAMPRRSVSVVGSFRVFLHHLPVSSRDFPLCLSVSPWPLLINTQKPCRRAHSNGLISPELPLERTSLPMQWHSEALGGGAYHTNWGAHDSAHTQCRYPV